MIKEGNGRAWSELTHEELEEALAKELKTLTTEEQAILKLMMKELQQEKKEGPTLLDALTHAEYKTVPVSVQQFLEDPYYMGEACADFYPKLKKDFIRLFESGIYNECLLVGSIGYGKSYFASIGICRILYELSCMKNPQKSFGIADKTQIALGCLSVNENLAIKVLIEGIASKLSTSPYFKEKFPYEVLKKEIKFPNNIWLAARATTDTSNLGLNLVGFLLDEGNFLNRNRNTARSNTGDRAESIYNQIKRRMKSRFERRGKLPGMLFIVSSKQTEDDFTAKRLREAKETSDPHVFCLDYSLWDVKEDAYSGERFKILVGGEAAFSRILSAEEEQHFKDIDNVPEGCIVIDVPIELLSDFERDLEGSIRDLAGLSTLAVQPYIQRREKITTAIDASLSHPFSVESYDASKGGRFLWEKMVRPADPSVRNGKTVPILNPGIPRHIHIDPSISGDATGICMCHIGGWKDVKRRAPDGTEYIERAPAYIVDFVLQIVPPIGGEIILADLRQIVYDLSAHGFTITSISMDGHNTKDTIQQLNAEGYNAVYQSVDKTMDPYDTLKMALYEDRVRYYDYPILVTELRKLEVDLHRGKVDHPSTGSKDTSDALAGAIYTLSGSKLDMPLPILQSLPHYPSNEQSSPPRVNALIPTTPAAPTAERANSGYNILPPFLIGDGSDDDGSNFPF